jgi:glycosyltransferase involved in cell wall biosynthesis
LPLSFPARNAGPEFRVENRLLVAATLPPWPVRDGLAVRLAAMLKALSERWDIALVAPRLPASEAPVRLRWYEWKPVEPAPPWGFMPWRFDGAPLRAALARACTEFAPTAGLAFFGAEHCWPADGPPVVHDRVDCSTLTAWRYVGVTRGIRGRLSRLHDVVEFARYETRMLRSFRTVTVVGDDDARWLRRLGRGCDVHVIPNGVAPPATEPATRSIEPLVVFSGSMAYHPNVDAAVYFARHIWPQVRQAVPHARFLIAGRHPSPDVSALDGRDGIAVSGPVTDMAETIGRAWVAVAPMRCGAGVKNKILEAWAVGVPVVMFSLARNGLVLPAGAESLVQDDDAGFSRCVVSLLQGATRRAELGAEARKHVREHYAWRDMARLLDVLLFEAAGVPALPTLPVAASAAHHIT